MCHLLTLSESRIILYVCFLVPLATALYPATGAPFPKATYTYLPIHLLPLTAFALSGSVQCVTVRAAVCGSAAVRQSVWQYMQQCAEVPQCGSARQCGQRAAVWGSVRQYGRQCAAVRRHVRQSGNVRQQCARQCVCFCLIIILGWMNLGFVRFEWNWILSMVWLYFILVFDFFEYSVLRITLHYYLIHIVN
jgi:hypothetical protein